jgi:methanogenic corrinoid protein MtbC1
MKHKTKHIALIQSLEELSEEQAINSVQLLLSAGEDPLRVIETCQQGMRLVGERYHRGQYFIAGLIMAGEILGQVIEIVQPKLDAQHHEEPIGKVLVGTVEGDIHDLGKDIVKALLRCHGFSVTDLGVDVPASEFLAQAQKSPPDIIGLSALISATLPNLKDTIAQLRADPVLGPRKIPIIIGGAQSDEDVSLFTEADAWTTDAMEGVHICLDWMQASGGK